MNRDRLPHVAATTDSCGWPGLDRRDAPQCRHSRGLGSGSRSVHANIRILQAFGAVSLIIGLAVGCSQPIAHIRSLQGMQRVVVTDARAYGKETLQSAHPPVEITDPDRLAAFEDFLEQHKKRWERIKGDPRTSRFQLELMADGRKLSTFWFEPGYLQRHDGGKRVSAIRLTNAESADLVTALGLPPSYLY